MEIEDYIVVDDQQLVRLVLDGDPIAFEHLFNRYRESIHRLLIAKVGSAQDADDLLQETFIKVYINLERYSSKYTFGQWVYTIARNSFIDYMRKRHEDISMDDRYITPEATTLNPEENVINNQMRVQIESSIASLSPTHQTLFKMRFLDGYSYEEIAQRLNMPLGSVKTNIHRARVNMCKLILKHDC